MNMVKLFKQLSSLSTLQLLKGSMLVMAILCSFLNNVSAQTTYAWRNDQAPAANENWDRTVPSIMWWRGYAEVPTGSEILTFDGSSANMTSVNNLSATNRFRILFDNTN